jgi:hypothetical protein
MMPARTGEFAFGAILNFFPLGRLKRAQSRLVADGSFLALVGLLIFLPKPEEFPGLIVFLACACTSALILYGNNGTVSGPALTNRVSVKIGLISYSLYLIHWPLIQYAQGLGYPMQGITPALLVMLGLALAALSEKWIERPFRTTNGPWKSRLSVAASGGLAVIFVCFVLAHTIMRKGFPERIPESVRHVAESIDSERDRRYATLRSMCGERSWESCKARSDTERNVLIIGDSQAVDGLNILNAFAPENHYILDSVAGCPPMTFPSFAREIDRTLETYDECEEQVRRYDTAEMYRNIDTVIISASYEQPSDLGDFLTQLRVHFDGNVLVFGRSTQFSRELPDFVMSARPFPRLEKRAFLELSQHEPFDLELLEIASKHDAKFESKISWFCSDTEQECDVFVDQSSLLISYDRSHLSKRAAEWIGSQFRKKYGNWEGLFPSSPGRGRSMPQRRTGPR